MENNTVLATYKRTLAWILVIALALSVSEPNDGSWLLTSSLIALMVAGLFVSRTTSNNIANTLLVVVAFPVAILWPETGLRPTGRPGGHRKGNRKGTRKEMGCGLSTRMV